jgi:magnesium transporter
MTVYTIADKLADKIAEKMAVESAVLPARVEEKELFIICCANEVPGLLDVFGWDKSAMLECTNLDETVRFTSYERYDFVSLIFVETENSLVSQREVNLFFAKKHLVLVLPDNMGARLGRLEDRLRKSVWDAAVQPSPLVYLYYVIFNNLAADFSETLELLEDEIEALAEKIVEKPGREQITEIGRLRKAAYTYKKMLRALSYIGGQILIDENRLIDSGYKHYFYNIDARLMKQYDFAESLYDLSTDLLRMYDSKFSVLMSETVNKLAAIALIFGPLTVIAGIYGMNFINMPELEWAFGYPFSLGIMAVVGLGIYLIMKKKKWL